VNARSHSNGHGVEFLAAVYVSNGVSNKHDVFTLESLPSQPFGLKTEEFAQSGSSENSAHKPGELPV
jgi:hypothetical protein